MGEGERPAGQAFYKGVQKAESYHYRRLTLIFDEAFRGYERAVQTDIDDIDINHTVLDNGLALSIQENGRLALFQNKPGSTRIDIIDDPRITPDMRICKDGVQARFFKGNSLFTIRRNHS